MAETQENVVWQPRSRAQRVRWLSAAIGAAATFAACALGFGAWRWHERAQAAMSIPKLKSLPVSRPAVIAEPKQDFLGVILNGTTVDLASKVEGRLQTVCCQVGDRVNRGQVVATLETHTIEQELLIAEASLRAARAEEHRALIELAAARERLARRQQTSEHALSVEELSSARYDKRTSEARLGVARAKAAEGEARVAQLEGQLRDAELRAPADSLVATRYADPGALIRPGMPVVRLISADQMRVRFAVPEEEGGVLLVGAPVKVAVKATGTALVGKVENVAPEVDSASRMIFALATLERPPDSNGKLFSGMVVRVTVDEAPPPPPPPPPGPPVLGRGG